MEDGDGPLTQAAGREVAWRLRITIRAELDTAIVVALVDGRRMVDVDAELVRFHRLVRALHK
jgi:hypothetical protein